LSFTLKSSTDIAAPSTVLSDAINYAVNTIYLILPYIYNTPERLLRSNLSKQIDDFIGIFNTILTGLTF